MPVENAHVRAVRSMFCHLVDDLDCRDIMDYLYQESLLSEDDYEDILSCNRRRERNRIVLVIVLRKVKMSARFFSVFCAALSDNYVHLSEGLMKALSETDTEVPGKEQPKAAKHVNNIKVIKGKADMVDGEQRSTYENLTSNLQKNLLDISQWDEDNSDDVQTISLNVNQTCVTRAYDKCHSAPNNIASQQYSHQEISWCQDIMTEKLCGCPVASEGTQSCGVCQRHLPDYNQWGPIYQSPPPANSAKYFKDSHLRLVFDKLSHVINCGHYDDFIHHQRTLQDLRPADADLKCVLMYLESCVHLFKGNYEKCENLVDSALNNLSFTSLPCRYLVELLSLKIWLCLKHNRTRAVESTLSDALQVIHANPLACAGKAAGWIYVDEAKHIMSSITPKNINDARIKRHKAMVALNKAIENFLLDDSLDGPYGVRYAELRLASVCLGCGDLMQTTDIQPSQGDMLTAQGILTNIEGSTQPLVKVLWVHVYLLRCDLHFRKHNLSEAMTCADLAVTTAADMELAEELTWAQSRASYLTALMHQITTLQRYVRSVDIVNVAPLSVTFPEQSSHINTVLKESSAPESASVTTETASRSNPDIYKVNTYRHKVISFAISLLAITLALLSVSFITTLFYRV